jgi:hypothetical protein
MNDDNNLVRRPNLSFAQAQAQKTANLIAQVTRLEAEKQVMREALERIAAGSNDPQSEARAALDKITKPL